MQITNAGANPSATLNEILSQAETWQRSLSELKQSANLERFLHKSQSRTEWLFVGCGTSFYLADVAARSWTLLTGQRARALPASEPLIFPGLVSPIPGGLQAVVISRSGQTSEALRVAELLTRKLQVPTLGITCTADSALEKACDNTLQISTAEEKSTVMTRSFTSMLLAVQYLAARKSADGDFISALDNMACHFAAQIRSLADRIAAFVNGHSFADYVFLGQGPFHGIAREASLKVTEMSCSYSQVFHTLEFRHGPKAIVSPETCLTFFLSESGHQAEGEVLAEIKDLGGVTVAVCNRADNAIRRSCDLLFEFGFEGPEVSTLAPFVVPAQLLGFFTGIKKELDPDHPKNLTRVVIL